CVNRSESIGQGLDTPMKRNLAIPMPSWRSLSLPEGRLGFYLAPVAALIYPATLWSFHLSVSAFETGERVQASATSASVYVALAFVLACLVLLVALHLAGITEPNALQLRARKVAFLAVAAPTIFGFLGVLLFMAGNPVPDGVVWAVIWMAAIGFVGYGRSARAEPRETVPAQRTSIIRVTHGISAAAIILMCFGLDLGHQLLCLVASEPHGA